MGDAAKNRDMERIGVDLGGRSYDIHIGSGLLQRAGGLIAPLLSRPVCVVVSDENVAGHYMARFRQAMAQANIGVEEIVVPPGEGSKSYRRLEAVCERLLMAGVERQDMIVALGGGVIGDLAGFAAAILRRGVDFVQIPTSLLAQVDSSIGGKTGINSPLGKNLIGAFHQPRMVIADTDVLATLPQRELAAGYAEVVKYGLLGDAEFFSWLEDGGGAALLAREPGALKRAIATSCRVKAAIVARDEREGGVRALLNLGHTFGHALEAATGYGPRLLHGEAVGLGMAMAFRFAEFLGRAPAGTAGRVESHLSACSLPTRAGDVEGELPGPEDMLDLMHQDKKAKAGRLTFIVPDDIGKARIVDDIDDRQTLEFLQQELSPSCCR